MIAREIFLAGDGDRQRVADPHRQREVQCLVNGYRARAGKLGAEHIGNQGAAPHAMGNHLAQHGGMSVFRIDM